MTLLTRSLELDREFIKLPISTSEKIDFILKKYLLIIKNHLLGFKIGSSRIKVFGKNFYFYDKFGIAFLESVLQENQILVKYIKPKATVVDIGAHVGEFHIFARKILNADRVISVEPIRESYSLLQKNASEETYHYAISTKSSVKMYTPDTTIMSSTLKGENYRAVEKSRGIYLDDLALVSKTKQIDLLKIDVEGGEFDVLCTARKTLQKTKYLFVEVSIQRPASGDIFNVLGKIKEFCPGSKLIHVGKPFLVSGKPMCVDLLFRCN